MKEYNPIKKLILRELSEDSRITVTILAKKLKCSRNTIIKNMELVEKEFGVRYTLEIDKKAIGVMHNQVTTIRFAIKPSPKEIERMFEDSRYMPLVAVTEGDFDMLIKQIGDNTDDYMNWSLDLIKKMLPYRPTFKTSIVNSVTLGFIPMQSDVIARLDLSALRLTPLDKKILILLNDDSRTSYVDISKKLKIDVGTVRYRLKRIIKSNVVKRFTIVMEKPPLGYHLAFFMNYELAPGIFERARQSLHFYQDVDGKMPLLNSFQYVAGMIGSYSTFGLAGFDNEEAAIKNTVLAFKEMFKEDNVSIVYARISRLLRGSLPVRNVDIARETSTLITLLDMIKKTKGNI